MVKSASTKLVREMMGGEPYEYYPLGQSIVAAPGVCRGRPTFKYMRIDVHHALGLRASRLPIRQNPRHVLSSACLVQCVNEETAMVKHVKVIVEKHPDGYVAYPLGLKGVIVGEGDTYEEALADVKSAITFHMETFGSDVVEEAASVLEVFVAEAGIPL